MEELLIFIELIWGHGHVEIGLRNNLYGFWPDSWKSRRVPGSSVSNDDDARKGGYYGELRIRDIDKLASYYNVIYQYEKDFIELPQFHIFSTQIETFTADEIVNKLSVLSIDPPEYSAYSTNKSKNCVSLTLDLLKQINIIEEEFSLPRRIPRPVDFFDKLFEMSKLDDGIKYEIRKLQPAKLTIMSK